VPKTGAEDHLASVAEVLAYHFGGNPEIAEALPEREKPSLWSAGLILALARGWPEDPILDELYTQLRQPDCPPVYLTEYFSILYNRVPAEALPIRLIADLGRRESAAQRGLKIVTGQLVQRLRTDHAAREALERALESGLDANGKTSFPKLLASAVGVSQKLATWCQEEIERQVADDSVPEFGFDMISGQVSAVVHSLLDVMQTSL